MNDLNLLAISKPVLYAILVVVVFFVFMFLMGPIRLWRMNRKMDKIIELLREIRDKKSL